MRTGNKSGNSKRKRKSGKPKKSIQLEKWRNQNDSIMKTRTREKNDQLRSAECSGGLAKNVGWATSDPTVCIYLSPLSKMFPLYQIVLQLHKDRRQAPPEALGGEETAS